MHFNNLVQSLSPHLLPVQIQHEKTREEATEKSGIKEEPQMVTQIGTPVCPSEVLQFAIGIIVR